VIEGAEMPARELDEGAAEPVGEQLARPVEELAA
jgi:hypothetical protein